MNSNELIRERKILVKAEVTFDGTNFLCKFPKGFEKFDNGNIILIAFDTLDELLNSINYGT